MTEAITGVVIAVLALSAGGFCLVAAIGVLRFPDALSRMHAASKAGAMGGSCALIAAGLHMGEAGGWLRAGLAVLFLLLTAPLAAHLLGRAAAWRAGRDIAAREADDS